MGSDFFASDQPFEMPGRSCLLQVGGRVFHTYSQYARGLESTGGSYYFLDLTALGRQEEWENPRDAASPPGPPRPTSRRNHPPRPSPLKELSLPMLPGRGAHPGSR
jgi:hypothetical protein